MARSTCHWCGVALPEPTGAPGRPPDFCGVPCRRAEERELALIAALRLDFEARAITNRLNHGGEGQPATQARYAVEIAALVAREAAVLAGKSTSVSKENTPR